MLTCNEEIVKTVYINVHNVSTGYLHANFVPKDYHLKMENHLILPLMNEPPKEGI